MKASLQFMKGLGEINMVPELNYGLNLQMEMQII